MRRGTTSGWWIVLVAGCVGGAEGVEPGVVSEALRVSGVQRGTPLAVGASHACAVQRDGAVRCWGSNQFGQLGVASPSTSAPVLVAGAGAVFSLAAGGDATCAVTADGRVRCWGRNDNGQLGDGTALPRLGPVEVAGLTGVAQVAVGGGHACALLATGTVHCWGLNADGQLGDGTTTARATPALVPGATQVVSVACGAGFTCALHVGGTVSCWGRNTSGQLGDGGTVSRRSPARVSGIVDATAIAAGSAHACVLRPDGSARCWGHGAQGQLGDGALLARTTPVPVQAVVGVRFASLALGWSHSCGTTADGQTWCWGDNADGQAGIGFSSGTRPSPTLAATLVSARVAVSGVGARTTCALAGTSELRCWGSNTAGQAGASSGVAVPSPGLVALARPVASPGQRLAVINSDYNRVACVLRGSHGQLACAGMDVLGFGFAGSAQRVSTWIDVTGASDFTSIALGSTSFLGLRSNGTVWVAHGAGLTQVAGLRDVVSLAEGGSHRCAVRADGTLWCWGSNDFGQLGDGTTTARATPVLVPGLTGVVAVAATGSATCALVAGGVVWCWGNNQSGELGDGTWVGRTSPRVLPLFGVASISAAGRGVCAILSSGQVRCWGWSSAQWPSPMNRPTVIPNLPPASAVVLSVQSACGLFVDGTTRCWDGSLTPSLVAGSSPYTQLAVGAGTRLGLRTDGAVEGWGDNHDGQLGLGHRLGVPAPTVLPIAP